MTRNKWRNKFFPSERQAELFPNSARLHAERLRRVYDDDGVDITAEIEQERKAYARDYGFGHELAGGLHENPVESVARQLGITAPATKSNSGRVSLLGDSEWGSYLHGDGWGGYQSYRPATLTYQYVVQMATMLTSQHGVSVRIGTGWAVDLEQKTLTYCPATLMYGTKGELLATLLHEIGKLTHSAPRSHIRNNYIVTHGNPAYEALLAFEDFRIDTKMLASYVSAPEIYENAKPSIVSLVEKYARRSDKQNSTQVEAVTAQVRAIQGIIREYSTGIYANDSYSQNIAKQNRAQLVKMVGSDVDEEIDKRLAHYAEFMAKKPTLWGYCGAIIATAYGLDTEIADGYTPYLDKTAPAIATTSNADTTQALADTMTVEVYPHIAELLRDVKDGAEETRAIVGNARAREIMEQENSHNGSQYSQNARGVQVDANGKQEVRQKAESSGPGRNRVPQEWLTGEYAPLLASVEYEIKELTRRLTFLKRTEQTVNYVGGQKRGKLNAKKLYRHATGSVRLFKQKLDKMDTVQSFAFSVMIDVSGSMYSNGGNPFIVHAVRGAVLLSEVFDRMGIPFEIAVFGSTASGVKTYADVYGKSQKNKLAGLIRKPANQSTNLDQACEYMDKTITKQTEKNRVVVLLSDGGVGGDEIKKVLQDKFFTPWENKGVKTVAFGIETGDEIRTLCPPHSKDVATASDLPKEFSELIKQLIKL